MTFMKRKSSPVVVSTGVVVGMLVVVSSTVVVSPHVVVSTDVVNTSAEIEQHKIKRRSMSHMA